MPAEPQGPPPGMYGYPMPPPPPPPAAAPAGGGAAGGAQTAPAAFVGPASLL